MSIAGLKLSPSAAALLRTPPSLARLMANSPRLLSPQLAARYECCQQIYRLLATWDVAKLGVVVGGGEHAQGRVGAEVPEVPVGVQGHVLGWADMTMRIKRKVWVLNGKGGVMHVTR